MNLFNFFMTRNNTFQISVEGRLNGGVATHTGKADENNC